jgi:hypothetical protein
MDVTNGHKDIVMNLSGVVVMSTRSIFMAAFAGCVAFALPAHADTTIKSDDASVELTVPNGWRQTKTAAPAIQIQATNGRAVVLVRVAQKEDFKDLKSFAQIGSARFMKNLTDAEPKTEDVQVNGKPAIRISAEGTQSNGQRRGFVMTFMDTDGMFVEVIGIANASAFKTEQQTIADMAGKVKVLAAAGATAQTPPRPGNPPPAATPPATTPPATTPPAAAPPAARQPR